MARRRNRVAIGFLVVWLIFWTAGMLVVLWLLGGTLLRGELGAAPFLMLWLGAAGFGLWLAGRRLARMLLPDAPPRGSSGRHVWRDDLPDRPEGRG